MTLQTSNRINGCLDDDSGRTITLTVPGAEKMFKPGDMFTVSGITVPKRKWRQFWKPKNPDAGKPAMFRIVERG